MSVRHFCCSEMKQNIAETKCILYSDIFDEYGLPVPGDSESFLLLKYCPWCGKVLPNSNREEWFEKLEKLGFDDPLFEDSIPIEFKTSKWRSK